MVQQVLSEIGANRIIKYGYGGMLFALLAAIIDPTHTKTVVSSLGPLLAPLSVFSVGIAIYIVHRYVIGEFLFRLTHIIHNIYDRLDGSQGLSSTCTTTYLEALGVKRGNSRSAYTAMRKLFFEQDVRSNFDKNHAELNVLYITAEETLLAAVYLAMSGSIVMSGRISDYLLIISLVFYWCAITGDIRQHRLECHLMKTDRQKLCRLLQNVGYLSSNEVQ